jgi:hypothetical protein
MLTDRGVETSISQFHASTVVTAISGMVRVEVIPRIVAGVCDPGIAATAGLTEAG